VKGPRLQGKVHVYGDIDFKGFIQKVHVYRGKVHVYGDIDFKGFIQKVHVYREGFYRPKSPKKILRYVDLIYYAEIPG
jgi:hypothetical protein